MDRTRAVVLLAFSIGTFWLAAKAHGRQIRLERERAGYMQVDFRARNPPFVEALWWRDRWCYWLVAATMLVLVLLALVGAPRLGLPGPRAAASWLVLWAAWLVPMVTAFFVAGLVSLARLWSSRAEGLDFTRASLPMSAVWFSLALAGVVVTMFLAAPFFERS
jgi:hypothetical protein